MRTRLLAVVAPLAILYALPGCVPVGQDGGGAAMAAARPAVQSDAAKRTESKLLELVDYAVVRRDKEVCGSALTCLFLLAGEEGMDRLCESSNITVQLNAAWRHWVRPEVGNLDILNTATETAVQEDGARRFLDRLRRVCKAEPPQWWLDQFVRIDPNRHGTRDRFAQHWNQGWDLWRCPVGIEVVRKGGRKHLRVRGRDVPLDGTDGRILAAAKDPFLNHVDAVIDGDNCCIILYSGDVPPVHNYPLFQVEADTGRVISQQVVWGTLHGAFDRTLGASLCVTEGEVIVFGMGPATRYVEAFSRLNGSVKWRFWTSGARQLPEG